MLHMIYHVFSIVRCTLNTHTSYRFYIWPFFFFIFRTLTSFPHSLPIIGWATVGNWTPRLFSFTLYILLSTLKFYNRRYKINFNMAILRMHGIYGRCVSAAALLPITVRMRILRCFYSLFCTFCLSLSHTF